MSVYTSVDRKQIQAFLKRYDIGEAVSLQPVAAGITNTNYLLDTDQGAYVLTLYEHHSDDELDYMLGLQQHLAERAVKCSRPIADRRGEFFSSLNQRPAAIIGRVAGKVNQSPGSEHNALIGAELARFHLAGSDFPRFRANPRGPDWIVAARDILNDQLSDTDCRAIDASLDAIQQIDIEALPRGAIHADLFHDNALFDGDGLGGILDFDYACTDCFVFDIAVLLNDWCIDAQNCLIDQQVQATLEAYRSIRSLSVAELEVLPLMLRLAALRFWLSRLYDKTFPLSGELTFIKCPDSFRNMHQLRSEQMQVAPG